MAVVTVARELGARGSRAVPAWSRPWLPGTSAWFLDETDHELLWAEIPRRPPTSADEQSSG